MEQHPEATIQEAALESGFNSRQAYYTFKSRQE
jgi:AraC-like DNA-binding protein